jgi:uncharacterized membrane protein
MTDRTLRLMIGSLAVAGAAVAGYLTYARYSGTPITCTSGGCETVQSSEYATVAGIPVALLGLLAYAVLFATALAAADTTRTLGAAVALTAFVFSSYLLFVQVAIIGAVCDWCVVSDAITTVLVPFTGLRLRPQPALRPR